MILIDAYNKACFCFIEDNMPFDEKVVIDENIPPLFKFYEYEDNAIYNSGTDKKSIIKDLLIAGYVENEDYEFV